jgi:nonsense-mediated mRNA decay protein 3
MRKRFCPKCGKEAEELYDNLCGNCFISKFSVAEKLPDRLVVKQCKICGKFFTDRHFNSLEAAVESFLESVLEQKEIFSASYRIDGNKVILTLKLRKNNLEKTEQKTINLLAKKIICQACSMKQSGYFQATLQVRAPENLLQNIRNEIESQINHLNQYDKLAFVSDFQKTKNGFDFFIGSKNAAEQIAGALKLKYKANIKITRKLSGSIKGKKIYRETIFVRVD